MPRPSQNSSCRRLLKNELLRRKKAKPSYSLNAFARDLSISSGFLSQVLTGKKNLSISKAFAISNRLSWPPKKQRLFLDLVQYEIVSGKGKEVLLADVPKTNLEPAEFSPLEIEKFELISNWYHYAILELCDTEGFKSDHKWIAEKLRVSEREVQDAIDRLIRLKLLNVEKGVFKKKRNNSIKSVPSSGLRNFHRQHLENAKRSLTTDHFFERDFSGTTVCTSPQQLLKAKRMIQEFRAELTSVLESGPRTHVYHLAVQLFPLSKG